MPMNPRHPGWVAFVNEMRANRVDRVSRLVFADWCEDTFGDQPFAKFVRETCQIADLDEGNRIAPVNGWDVPHRPGLQPDWEKYLRCEALLRDSWMLWPPLAKMEPMYQRQWRFHAGYPDRVVIDFDGWMKSWRALLAIGPVGAVHVFDNPGCHQHQGPNLMCLTPACMELVHLAVARKVDHQVWLPKQAWYDSRQRFSRGIAERLAEAQAVEIVMNRVWAKDVSVIYVDEPRGDQPEEYANR